MNTVSTLLLIKPTSILCTQGDMQYLEKVLGHTKLLSILLPFVNNKFITPVAQNENIKEGFYIINKMKIVLSIGAAIKNLLGSIMSLLLK